MIDTVAILTGVVMAVSAYRPYQLIASRLGRSGWAAAIVTLVQALSQEVREFGITVNAVAPSTMDTPGNRAAMPDSDRKGWVPVESVAAAIAWLAAEESAHVTGTVVAV